MCVSVLVCDIKKLIEPLTVHINKTIYYFTVTATRLFDLVETIVWQGSTKEFPHPPTTTKPEQNRAAAAAEPQSEVA